MELSEIMLVNPQRLYELYQCNQRNHLPDLTVGMAYYREEHPEITQAEDDAMIGFISRHSRALAKAYPNELAFYQAWAEGIAADLKRAQEQAEEESREDQEAGG